MVITRQKPWDWADEETLKTVRPSVRAMLEASPAFAKLSDAEKRDIAGKMVKVASYMANPEGLASQELSAEGSLLSVSPSAAHLRTESDAGAPARALADPVQATKTRLSQDPGFAGEDFQAGAVRQGVQEFGNLVKKVDFPKFVSGLVKGVFQAIVESSIEQMRAYGELLANVAKTVDEFAKDNISENNARDWLAQKFPDKLGVESSQSSASFAFADAAPGAAPGAGSGAAPGQAGQGQPRLVPKGDDPEAAAKAISSELQLASPVTDLSDEEQEQRLVMAARLQMARSRQQLLASMVMLGINRIVVTDGLIHAKVVFDMKASDQARRRSKASMYDKQQEHIGVKASTSYGGWYTPVEASMSSEYSNDHVATVESSVDDASESKAEVKAKLTGEVRVNFKSDYFPMEKLANPEMIAAIQGNSKPVDKPAKGGA